MKALFIILTLSFSFSLFADQNLALSDCAKGNQEGRSKSKKVNEGESQKPSEETNTIKKN